MRINAVVIVENSRQVSLEESTRIRRESYEILFCSRR
jgi:hypothetical protein